MIISFTVARQQIVGQEILIGHAIVCIAEVEVFEHLGGHMVAKVEVFLESPLAQTSVFGMTVYRLFIAQQR